MTHTLSSSFPSHILSFACKTTTLVKSNVCLCYTCNIHLSKSGRKKKLIQNHIDWSCFKIKTTDVNWALNCTAVILYFPSGTDFSAIRLFHVFFSYLKVLTLKYPHTEIKTFLLILLRNLKQSKHNFYHLSYYLLIYQHLYLNLLISQLIKDLCLYGKIYPPFLFNIFIIVFFHP